MQLLLFERNVLLDVFLKANSSKNAFYHLMLTFERGRYFVEKESGASGKILDSRKWAQKDFDAAEKFFNRKLAAKTSLKRRSPRKYEAASAEDTLAA